MIAELALASRRAQHRIALAPRFEESGNRDAFHFGAFAAQHFAKPRRWAAQATLQIHFDQRVGAMLVILLQQQADRFVGQAQAMRAQAAGGEQVVQVEDRVMQPQQHHGHHRQNQVSARARTLQQRCASGEHDQ